MTGWMRNARVVILFCGLIGCSADQPSLTVAVRDSLGIRIVENQAPVWSAVTSWVVDSVPALEIASPDSAPLFRVRDVIGLGVRIAALNAGSSEVLLFDSTGQLLRRIGRQGSGPDEFARLTALYLCGEDTLVVNDFSRISTFDSDGAFVRTGLIARGDEFLRVRGVAADCSTFVLGGAYSPIPGLGETGRRSSTLAWGRLDGAVRDTIGRFAGQEVATRPIEGMDQALYLPWGADGVWAVSGDRFYFGSSERNEIRVFERGKGLVELIRWAAEHRPITSDDRRLYDSKREALLEQFPQLEIVVPRLDQFPSTPEYVPYFRAFKIDDESNLWVREYPHFLAGRPDLYDLDVPMRHNPRPGDVPEEWSVFDPTGRWLGEVRVPPQLAVRSIYRDQVIGVWKDSLDVEYIRIYRLHKNGEN